MKPANSRNMRKYVRTREEWNDNEFDIHNALHWISYGFTVNEAIEWRKLLYDAIIDCRDQVALPVYPGLVAEIDKWQEEIRFSVGEYVYWSIVVSDLGKYRKLGYTRHDMEPFLLKGYGISESVDMVSRLDKLGMVVPNLQDWLCCGFPIDEIILWIKDGKDLEFAKLAAKDVRNGFHPWKYAPV